MKKLILIVGAVIVVSILLLKSTDTVDDSDNLDYDDRDEFGI